MSEEQKPTLKNIREEAEREYIVKVLNENRGNKSKVCEILGIDRKTLYNKLDRYEITKGNEVAVQVFERHYI